MSFHLTRNLTPLEASPDGIFEGPRGTFHVVANVYVTLNYGPPDDSASLSDSFPVQITGTISDSNEVEVITVEVDTSSFFE